MFSNGLRTNKSGSPEIIQSALPEGASSRYMLSSRSRHAETLCVIITLADSLLKRERNLLSSIGRKYLLNLSRLMTSFSSAYTSSEKMTLPILRALSKAWLGVEPLCNAALSKTLVSKIKFNYFFFRGSSNNAGVKPRLRAYSPISSITSRRDLLSSIKRLIISAKSFFSFWVKVEKRSASSSEVSSVIVFILQSITTYHEI